jgi:hypothetical protein
MNTSKFGKMSLIGLSLLSVWLGGCGELSPFKGSGALYILDHGISRCVNVRSVSFNASHWTTYTDNEGKEFSASEPVAYYAYEKCK